MGKDYVSTTRNPDTMGRIELTGDSLTRVFYALQLAVIALFLLFAAVSLEWSVSAPLVALFVLLLAATAVGLWRRATGRDEGAHFGTAEDITYDPFGDPGQAARHNWEKAVRRLPGDDERDGDGD